MTKVCGAGQVASKRVLCASGFVALALLPMLGVVTAVRAEDVVLSLGNAIGNPGRAVTIPISVSIGGGQVASINLGIVFPSDRLQIDPSTDCQKDPRLTGNAAQFQLAVNPAPPLGHERLAVSIFDGDALEPIATFADGVAAQCTFRILTAAAAGMAVLEADAPEVGDASFNELPSRAVGGTIEIAPVLATPPTRTPTVTTTPTRPSPTKTPTQPGVPVIEIGTVIGPPGSIVGLPVTLRTSGQSVASFQNDIAFDSTAPVRAKPGSPSKPDCEVNPGIAKDASSFAFLPSGCQSNSSCTTVRASILSTQSTNPIADGTVAYVCRVGIAANATLGEHALRCGVTDAATPDHVMLHPDCRAGSVRVGSTPLCIGNCRANGSVTIDQIVYIIPIALGQDWVGSCLLGDEDGDGAISINEIIKAVNNALKDCPS